MDKTQINLEYIMKCSPKVLYNRLSTASGLAEWFADDVRVRGKQFIFIWEGTEQVAEMTLKKANHLARYKWIDDDDDTFFEFKVVCDDLTGDVSLLITDFCDNDEEEETQDLWNSQISDLKQVLGS